MFFSRIALIAGVSRLPRRARQAAFSLGLLSLLFLAGVTAQAQGNRFILHRDVWSFNRSDIQWSFWATPENQREQKAKGTLGGGTGWVAYDFDLPAGGWYELWVRGAAVGWPRDLFIDGKEIYYLTSLTRDDMDKSSGPNPWGKMGNFYLPAGSHSLTMRRLGFPANLPSAWELRAADGDPAGCVRVTDPGNNVLRAGTKVTAVVEGGTGIPTSYDLVARNDGTGEILPMAEVSFPVSNVPVKKKVDLEFSAQGVYSLLARVNGNLLRPADLKGGQYIVVDTKNAPAYSGPLQTTPIVDIDCTAPPPSQGFWEKDGATRIVHAPFGSYRESSGLGDAGGWGTDGFSYRFDLPDTSHVYRLRVDYPDDDRRSMGFWIDDGATLLEQCGTINTGGVETGDAYTLTHRMLTHEAFFYPRGDKDLVVAVLNLVKGMKAAAARIRIDRVDSPLPGAPPGEHRGRLTGSFFEEPGRWSKFFGANDPGLVEQLKAMDRWGQWDRYIGANLMAPTINVYQGNDYPSHVLEGYLNEPYNEVRMLALIGEKYNETVVPEVNLGGAKWFDAHAMGVRNDLSKVAGKTHKSVSFVSKEAEETVLRDRDGNVAWDSLAVAYNVLHPKVQATYLAYMGELADSLGDCNSFGGISSRMMFYWQFQGWNALPGLNWGYGDWTIGEFEKETGIKVPGADGDPARFRQRYNFLTGPCRERWIQWRCQKVFDFHRRIRDRIQQAKPGAKLYLTWYIPFASQLDSTDIVEQMREEGIDARLYAHEPGIVIVPVVGYGRRFSSPVNDASVGNPLYDAGYAYVASLGSRALGLFGTYYEVDHHFDWRELGGKPYSAFDSCEPSGVNEREIYAMALANSDVSYILHGGSGWIFGTPDVMQPFLREYRALPAVPFEKYAPAQDPVAVWQHQDKDQSLWFYAVNRLPVPVKVELSLAGAAPKVVSSVDGRAVDAPGGKLDFTLEPFMLRGFRATNASLSGSQVTVPPDYVDKLKPMIAFARQLRDDLAARRIVPELSENETEAALQTLDEAGQAFEKGAYWMARGALLRLAAAKIYYASGFYPPGLLERSQPHGIPFPPVSPAINHEPADGGRGRLQSVADLGYDAKGNLWVGGSDRLLEIAPGGAVTKTLPLFEPIDLIQTDQYIGALVASRPCAVTRIGVLPSQVVIQSGGHPPVLYDADSGRPVRIDNHYGFPIPAPPSRLLGSLPDGTLLLRSSAPGNAGVYETNATGTDCRKLSDIAALDAASDASGDLFLLDAAGVKVLGKDGQAGPNLDEPGVSRIAASRDGKMLLLLENQGRTMTCYQLLADGTWSKQWRQPLPGPATALAFSPAGTVAIGFDDQAGTANVMEYMIDETGLHLKGTLIHGMGEAAAQSLDGFTQIKVLDGQLYYGAHGKLMRLTPGNPDQVEVAFDPKLDSDPRGFEAFAFDQSVNLFLASYQGGFQPGGYVYLCKKDAGGWSAPECLNQGAPIVEKPDAVPTDLAVDAQNSLILRLPNPAAKNPSDDVSLFRWTPGGKKEVLLDLGTPDGGDGNYGLSSMPDGGLLVAGGTTHSMACLAPDGGTRWRISIGKFFAPGYSDLRQPVGITQDSKGSIWVTDSSRHLLICFDAAGRMVRTVGHFGTTDDADGVAFDCPAGLAAIKDSSGKEWLYVADVGNHRLVKLALAELDTGGTKQ